MRKPTVLTSEELQKRLKLELERAERYVRPISVARMILDRQPAGGEEAGQSARAAIEKTLETSCRRSDIAGRYGRDEYAIILPETDATGAFAVAERMRSKAALAGSDMTVSAGVACYPHHTGCAKDLHKEAKKALEIARSAGNRVCGPLMDES
ncbi:MAG: GGDEF domain-containing protein [Terriglobia bacterium]